MRDELKTELELAMRATLDVAPVVTLYAALLLLAVRKLVRFSLAMLLQWDGPCRAGRQPIFTCTLGSGLYSQSAILCLHLRTLRVQLLLPAEFLGSASQGRDRDVRESIFP